MAPPDPPAPTPAAPAQTPRRVFPWMLAGLLFIALAVLGAFLWFGQRVLDSFDRGVEKGLDSALQGASAIAAAFRPESITRTFVEYTGLKVKGTGGDILEVATAEATETFTRTTNVVWFDRVVPIGTTVSEISVPATYRFHIDLKGPWEVAAYDGRVVVVAPPVQPSLPVAFDTAKMQKKTKSGWARWDGQENLSELESGLTAQLESRARSGETLGGIRDDSRLAVAKFVKNWLLSAHHWGASTYREIVVVFSDEIGHAALPSLLNRPATLRWEAGEDDHGGAAAAPVMAP